MTMVHRIAIALVITLASTAILGLGAPAPTHGVFGFISSAEARVGRPLTPVSVAGVGRRTARRCAAGVYNC
jgi:hypothetical protein